MASESASVRKSRMREGKRSVTKSDVTRERVLDAAAFVLSRKGFSGTRLSDIARVAGLQTGSLYYHFDSREDIVAEVMSRGVNQVFETVQNAIEALPEETGALERLRVAVETHLLCLLEHSDYARAVTRLSGQVPKEIEVQHAANEQAYGRLWKKLFRDARDSEEIRGDLNLSSVRMLMLGSMAWAVQWFKPENGPAAKVARDFSEMAFYGIIPRK